MYSSESLRTVQGKSKSALVLELIRVGVYADRSWSRDELVSQWLGKYGETAVYSFPAPTLVWG